jgi:radical SAM-linked protein
MKVRLRFTKLGKVRFTSHRDVARIFERAFRRADVPIALTQGYSPRPRISFGLALPTGHESDGEYLDADLATLVAEGDLLRTLPARLTEALPTGFEVTACAAVAPGTPSLQEDVRSCSWTIEVVGAAPDDLSAAVRRVLASPRVEVWRSRKGQERLDDIRPAIDSLDMAGPTPAGARVLADLATQPRGLRPSELVGALGAGWREGRVRRRHQWIERDGARREPLDPGATAGAPGAAHREVRAS